MSREVIRTNNFAVEASDFIINHARLALRARNEFRLALSGGNTPRPVYAELARRELPWERVVVTFGDERCVPPDDAESNFKMANETLLRPAAVPDSSVLRMRGEADPVLAATQYEEQLDKMAKEHGDEIFQHDLILLGLGDDGHTASLFPGTAALMEDERRVVANHVPKFQAWRLTFTYPLILAAHAICFLVDGNQRAKLIERVFAGDNELPATRVDANGRAVTWILRESG
jgi:6-phosphogluconolactonase